MAEPERPIVIDIPKLVQMLGSKDLTILQLHAEIAALKAQLAKAVEAKATT